MTRYTYLRVLRLIHDLELRDFDLTTELWDAQNYLRQNDQRALEELADDLELRLKKEEAAA